MCWTLGACRDRKPVVWQKHSQKQSQNRYRVCIWEEPQASPSQFLVQSTELLEYFGAADPCQVYVRTGVLRPETGGSGAFLRSLPSRIYGQSWLSCDRMYNELMYPDEPTACDTFLDRVAQDVRVMHTYMYVYVCMYIYTRHWGIEVGRSDSNSYLWMWLKHPTWKMPAWSIEDRRQWKYLG